MTRRVHRRYVAIGDSSTEGLDDPDGRGGYWGWSYRLANRLAVAQGSIEYARLEKPGTLLLLLWLARPSIESPGKCGITNEQRRDSVGRRSGHPALL